MKIYMMECGHASNSTINGKPYCAICDCSGINTQETKLQGRKAKCIYCGHITESLNTLPFFSHNKDKDTDSYYCGCQGWD